MDPSISFQRISTVVLAAMILLSASGATAEPYGVRLTVFGDPATSVAVSWNSDNPSENEVVYGLAADSLDQTVTAVETHALPDPLGTSFTARLENLEPDTLYHYRVGSASGELHPWGTPFRFRTMPADPCEPFRFVVLGDNRADFDNIGVSAFWSGILAEALVELPRFFINTGDMVKNGERPNEWEDFIDESEPGMARVASLLTMGNHDEDDVFGEDALYNRLFDLPRNSTTNSEDYYSIDVGPVHFVSLNTQFLAPGTAFLDDMLDWLRDDLSATEQPWVMVFFHKAVYSRGNHSSGEEHDGSLNAAFIPIFDEFDVDVVFNGHSHNYERYAPSVGVDREFGGSGRTFPAGDGEAIAARTEPIPDGSVGTTYVVTGGAGALTTDVFGFTCRDAACTYCTGFNLNCAEEVFENDQTGNIVYTGEHNFVIVDASPQRLDVQSYATMTGNVDGEFTIETFSMVNEDLDPNFCVTEVMDELEEAMDGEPVVDTGIADAPDPDVPDTPAVDDGIEVIDTTGEPQPDEGAVAEEDGGGTGFGAQPEDGCCSTADSRGGWFALALAGVLVGVLLRRRRLDPTE